MTPLPTDLDMALRRLPAAPAGPLIAAGAPVLALLRRDEIVKTARVAPLECGRFEFACVAEAGRPAWVIPVTDGLGDVTDAIAFAPENPARWRVLMGRAADAWALARGEGDPANPIRLGDAAPLRVHSSPWGWVMASGEGCALLDLARARFHRDAFADRPIIADGEAHAQTLAEALVPAPRRLRIGYACEEARIAA